MKKTACEPGEIVITVHGLGRTRLCMSRLARRLARAGFQPQLWGYWSCLAGIDAHAGKLARHIELVESRYPGSRLHFVTHSLGGIVVREALEKHRPDSLGRVVMLAPPNRGSAMARRLSSLLGWCIRPLPELSDDPSSCVCGLRFSGGYEVGIIAAADDGKVRIEDTHLPGETDHLVLPGTHTFLMYRADVAAQVVAFLRQGRFSRPVSALR